VVRKVYSHRRKLSLEIVKNKFPSNYHCLLFINAFRYHLDFTSYTKQNTQEASEERRTGTQ
jgi:hypothetical protein